MTFDEAFKDLSQKLAEQAHWFATAPAAEIEEHRLSREKWFGPTKVENGQFVTDWDRVGAGRREARLPQSMKKGRKK